jgi:hypothetical protein
MGIMHFSLIKKSFEIFLPDRPKDTDPETADQDDPTYGIARHDQ